MSYIILAAFVMGVKVVIDQLASHFKIDLQDVYYYIHPDRPDSSPNWWRHLSKPLYYCNVCMSSVWGTIGYLLIGWASLQDWMLHVIICAAIVSAVNWIESKI